MLRQTTNNRQPGFTLVEVLSALAITSVLMVILGNIVISSTRAVDTVVVGSVGDQEIKRGLKRLVNELQTTSTSVLTINTSNASYDTATFQTPGTYNGTVSWGAVDIDGVWRMNWTVRYVMSGTQLVRQVFSGSGSKVGSDELLVRNVDSLRGGVKGLRLNRIGSVIRITLRISRTYRDAKDYFKEYNSSVLLKND